MRLPIIKIGNSEGVNCFDYSILGSLYQWGGGAINTNKGITYVTILVNGALLRSSRVSRIQMYVWQNGLV